MYLKALNTGLVITALLAVGAFSAHAQDAATSEKQALIKELIELTGGKKNVDMMVETMIAQQEKDLPKLLERSRFSTENLNREERAELDRQTRESILRSVRRMRELFARLNYGQIVVDLATPIFGKHFSEAELREWIAFYKSPVGKKTIELAPVMMTEMMARVSDTVLPTINEELNKIVAEETAQLAQHAKSESAPPATRKPRTRRRH